MKVCIPLLRTLTTWHCPHSPPAHRAAVRRAAIDRYLLPARTDGRTDARQMHRPCSAYYAGSNISREIKMKTVTRCLHFTTRCTTGCTIGWMYYANELSQTAFEQPSQDVYKVVASQQSGCVNSRRRGAFDRMNIQNVSSTRLYNRL